MTLSIPESKQQEAVRGNAGADRNSGFYDHPNDGQPL